MSAFVYGEAELASALGLPVHLLQKARVKKLAADVDWALNAGRVAYSAGGAGSVVAMVNDPQKSPPPLTELLAKSRLRGVGEVPEISAKIARLFPNPHLVELTLPDGETCRISVQSKKNLRPGMVLTLAKTEDGYVLTQRLPRSVREGRNHARGT